MAIRVRASQTKWLAHLRVGGGTSKDWRAKGQVWRRHFSSGSIDGAANGTGKNRWFRGTAATFGLFGAVGGIYLVQNDEGVQRSLQFWKTVFPIYLHYRFVQWKVKGKDELEAEREYNRLHDMYSPIVEQLVWKMRGFYLKNAQMMSTVDFFVPKQYMAWCKRTQDDVPSEFKPGEVRRLIEASLKQPFDEVFSEFDDTPIGSASIGQVHKARLRRDGQLVAVKVMFPGIEARFRSDIKTLQDFCKLAMPQHVPPLKEIEKQFLTEFDYLGEARNLLEIHGNITPRWGDKVRVPLPIMDLCTTDVLVMEYLPGKRLLTGIRDMLKRYAESIDRDWRELEDEQLELIRSGQLELKNIDEQEKHMDKILVALKIKDSLFNTLRAVYNWSFGFVLPVLEYQNSSYPLNLAKIIKLLCEVHAYEIIFDGAFNGDPHPGNILLLDDGKLGLIDYGQVKHISPEIREKYATSILAIAHDDKDMVLQVSRDAGIRTKYNNPDIRYKLMLFWLDRNTEDVMEGRNIQEFLDYCESQDPAREVPEDWVMPGRVSVLLRGMGNAFGLDLRISRMFYSIAYEYLDKIGKVPPKYKNHKHPPPI